MKLTFSLDQVYSRQSGINFIRVPPIRHFMGVVTPFHLQSTGREIKGTEKPVAVL